MTVGFQKDEQAYGPQLKNKQEKSPRVSGLVCSGNCV